MKRLVIMMVLFGQVLVTGSALASIVALDFGAGGISLTGAPTPIPSAGGPVDFSFFDGFDTTVTATTTVIGINGTNNKTDAEPANWMNGLITADFSTTHTGLAGDLLFYYVLSGIGTTPDSAAILIDFSLGGTLVKHVPISSADTTTGFFQLTNTYTGLVFNSVDIQTTADAGTYQLNNIQYEAVPEPSTYALLVISLGVVGYARKRMTKKEL
jgi:hypothetical protein